MPIKILERASHAPNERVCVYGPPKTGKSRLATSVPTGRDSPWGEKVLYVCADAGSDNLRPVMTKYRGDIVPIVMEGKDLLEESVEIATKDWKKEVPGAGTLVWDTMTETSKQLLQQYANSGVFSDNHAVQVGKRGTKSWHTSPMQGDYGAAQNSVGYILEHLWTQPLNIIVLFHQRWIEPKKNSADGLMGGPEICGREGVRWIPGKFDNVFRTERVNSGPASEAKFIVHTTQRGIWHAGYRSNKASGGLPGAVQLQPDPGHFWIDFLKEVRG